ncbi:hypothetical protein B5E43_00735 [Flavonifractor sp. An100]|nr:hypothetical protein B5E43_00735 [Flavonifractor sp. An100]
MKRKTELLQILTSIMLIIALGGTKAYAAEVEGTFRDVPVGSWFEEAVAYVWENGLMSGTGEDTFSPDMAMTRGMLVTVLYRAAGSPSWEETGEETFLDVQPDAWYRDGVYWARAEGIADGYSQTQFGPNDLVTREQLVTMLWRFAGSEQAGGELEFNDQDMISSWAVQAVRWAGDNGLVSGKLGNFFDPQGQATRAETAVILTRYCQWAAAEDPESGLEEEEEPEEEEQEEQEEQPSNPLAHNPYDPEAFVVENGFLTYQGDAASHIGVDVSAHQGEIDWERVAASGVEFAMIRVGYRGYTAGNIYQDAYFEANINGALDAGLQVGIYFFSQATTVSEAREEALQTLEWIEDYDITYPVVFDWERVDSDSSRTKDTTGTVVTACAKAFCTVVEEAAYTPMTYGSPSKVGKDLHLSELTDYAFWLAHYTTGWQPTSFQYFFNMWQYSSNGSVDGIDGRVDLNLCLTNWPNS